MRIERHRIGALDAGEDLAAARGKHEEAAVGAVDVEPQALARGEVGERRQRVDGAGVHRAGGGDQHERLQPAGTVLADRRLDHLRRQPEARVAWQRPHVLGRQPGQHRRLLQRVVHLVGAVDGAAQEIRRQLLAPRHDERREVGQRPAGGEEAARRRTVADLVAHPSQHVGLELHEPRRRLPNSRIAVERVAYEVRDRAVEEAAAGDVGEVAGHRRAEAVRRGAVEEQRQRLPERLPVLGHRRDQRRRGVDGAVDVVDRLLRVGLDGGHEPPHRGIDQLAHLRAVGLEGPAAQRRFRNGSHL